MFGITRSSPDGQMSVPSVLDR